ncbi:piwi-like protein 1 [Montipora foliosa]|uniref:piwi-like protein 1 n=1 Tax=Montipora foliosa TaxID=591990 RepID=UPI0035F1DACB
MTGRARGRSRGRGRGGSGGDARRPGEGAQEVTREQAAPVGRGRARGPPPAQAPAPAPQRPAPAQVAPPTQAMAGMSVSQEQRPARRSRDIPDDIATKPEHIVDKKGGTGGKIALVTNHFKLKTKPSFGVYQYNVSFNPEQESKRVRVALLKSQTDVIQRVHAFDGMMLYLPIRLPETHTVLNLTKKNGDPVQMTIMFTNDVPRESPSMMQLLNIIFRRILKNIGMQQVGRNYYHVKRPIMIDKFRLELWPGYTTSIMPYETDVLLSADVSHKVLRQSTVLEYLYDLYGSTKKDFHGEACKKLIGQIILTRYNNKTYRIDDIKWDQYPSSTFKGRFKGEERDISYCQYYEEVYDKKIQDMDQPLLVSRLKKIPGQKMRIPDGEVLLVPELCFLTGLTDEMRNDFSLMKDLAVHTRVDPKTRNKSLLSFMGDICSNQESSAELAGWNLEFEKETLNLPGRVLPAEKIYQKNRNYSYDPKSADWSREMRGMALHSTVNLESWVLIYTNRDGANAKDFEQTLKKVGGPMGIEVSNATDCRIPDDRTEAYLRAINENYYERLQMVVVILTTNRKDRYDAIKKLCCLEKPVPSQVIVGRTISKKQMLMSVCTKIAIQLNCKLGGEAWAVEIPLRKTMVIGIDSYHDSSTKGRSVGGFVASVNQTLTKYYSRVSFQHTGMELIDGLKTNMSAALRRYNELNGDLPERIMIFRDGVGDGQLRTVVEHEVPQLKASFNEVSGGYKPKFSVVIVKKRISARLFHKGDGVNLTNPPPGTVVDSDITRRDWFDFFLVSQSVRQGTVSPTHYNVIEDSSGLQPDHFQRLTYKLTHLYYNWPGTVRVPAPCQYAHKLAFLVGQSLHKPPSHELADKLFFL